MYYLNKFLDDVATVIANAMLLLFYCAVWFFILMLAVGLYGEMGNSSFIIMGILAIVAWALERNFSKQRK